MSLPLWTYRCRRESSVAATLAFVALALAACAHPKSGENTVEAASTSAAGQPDCANSNSNPGCDRAPNEPTPDPRVGLKPGMFDAGEAEWNLHLVSNSHPPAAFENKTNSDLAFLGNYVIQGSYNGYVVWDISDPANVKVKTAYVCPASQSDVSVYKNLLFESAEAPTARLDCGAQAPKDTVSPERLRGLRIWDISDIEHPKNLANIQTCRGSHTHTLVIPPNDPNNVYIYISGSSFVRSASEMPGCVSAINDPNSARFRIDVIKVPLAHPEQAAIVSTPRIFQGLEQPVPTHSQAPEDKAEVEKARANGGFVASFGGGQPQVMRSSFVNPIIDSVAKARGATTPNAQDSATVRANLQDIVNKRFATQGPRILGTSCHDITVYPQIGLAGGACEGHGLLLDISDPANPVRIDAVADSNFSYWHSATFNNDGTKILFSDEWGGGGQPKCRASDPRAWGADAIFSIQDRKKMVFESYYKLPAPQTSFENCVAHNGSLIPIPGRDIMVQSWYQGGISVFDWTDAKHPHEIAFFDRGPSEADRMGPGGTWSAYWYNGHIVSSEIARGLDILELKPSALISANEIAAANTVRFDEFNTQGQPALVWPMTFVLARAYLDQLERDKGLSSGQISSTRSALDNAEKASGTERRDALTQLAGQLDGEASGSSDGAKVKVLATTVRNLATSNTAQGH